MIKVRKLEPTDDRSDFRSGNPDLDRFFIHYAGQNQFRHHIGTTYIAVEGDRILGFVTVAPSQIEIDDLPRARRKRLPRYPLPVLRLARLAVDERARGQGIGRLLLRSVFVLAREMASSLGCIGVVADAKPEAMDFYKQYGFEPLEVLQGALGDRPEPVSLFLPLSAVPEQRRRGQGGGTPRCG
jgi:GNAT superfamily N-acetyltransferase